MSVGEALPKTASISGTVIRTIAHGIISNAHTDQTSQVASQDQRVVFFIGNEKLPVMTPLNKPNSNPKNVVIRYSSMTFSALQH